MTLTETADQPNDASNRHKAQVLRDDRRIEVGRMILSHASSREIGRQLGVSHQTVLNDVKVVRRWWHARAVRHYDDHIAEEVAKLDELERSWMPVANVSLEALDRVLRIMERRAKLLGLDMPTRNELTVNVSEEELRARALELVTQHAERRAMYDEDDVIDVEGEET